jgi:hypothetical protein
MNEQTPIYQEYPVDLIFGPPKGVLRTLRGVTSFVPFDPDNVDYQLYLEWLEEGNTPLPAD